MHISVFDSQLSINPRPVLIGGAALIACCALACTPDDDPTNNTDPNVVANNQTDAGTNNSTPDGGTVTSPEVTGTMSPTDCQTDLEVIRTEDNQVSEHPIAYRGDFFGYGEPNGFAALISLVDDSVLIEAGSPVPGGTQETIILRDLTWAVAPDNGDNELDYPVAIQVEADDDNSLAVRRVILYSDGQGGLTYGVGEGDSTSATPPLVIDGLGRMRLGPDGALYFEATVEGSNETHIFKKLTPSSSTIGMIREGQALPALEGDDFTISELANFEPTGSNSLVARAELSDSSGAAAGLAYLEADGFERAYCSLTDAEIGCLGVIPVLDAPIDIREAAATATGAAAVFRQPDQTIFTAGFGQEGSQRAIAVGETIADVTFNDFGRVRICDNRDVYFVANVSKAGRAYSSDELFLLDNELMLTQVTNFASLLAVDELRGEVPNEIRDFALGHGCDAVMYTYGPSGPTSSQGYEGYWISYRDTKTIEIIDETPGRANGNGSFDDVAPANSGLDSNAGPDERVTIGPNGEFYFVSKFGEMAMDESWNYIRATRPACAN